MIRTEWCELAVKFSAIFSQAMYFSSNFIHRNTIVSNTGEQTFWSVFKVSVGAHAAVKI